MNINAFAKKLDKIVSQDDLAIRYYQATNENIDDLVTDMWQLMQKSGIADSDVEVVLRNSIKMAISRETSILDILSIKELIPTDITGNIGRYFEDVGRVYERNDNDMNIEYCPENRERLIEMNTKAVIHIAKQYRNKGVEFEDLISAGNLGLCIAFDKFKPKNKLEKKLGEEIDRMYETEETVDGSAIVESLTKHITYGDLYNRLCRSFKKGHPYKKDDINAWINKNVTSARFNSVASMWIRAYIIQELKNSTLVYKPNSERLKSKTETGVYNPDVYISMDRPITEDSDTTLENFMQSDDNVEDNLGKTDARVMVRAIISKLMKDIPVRDRRIFLEKMGIGLPRPMQPKEIAEREDLSIARVSQIIQQVMVKMKENAEELDIPKDKIYSILESI